MRHCAFGLQVHLLATMAVVPSLLLAQTTTHRIVQDLRIDANIQQLDGLWEILIDRDGTIVLPHKSDGTIRYFSPTGVPTGTAGRRGEGPGEFRTQGELGWTGRSLWVADVMTQRITWIDSTRRADKSRSAPTQVFDGNRERLPLGYWLFLKAAFPNGDVVVEGRFEENAKVPSWGRGLTVRNGLVLLIDSLGVFKRLIAAFPENPCSRIVTYANGKGSGSLTIPFCFEPISTYARDGSSLLLVLPTGPILRPTGYRVLQIGIGGDTLLDRRYAAVPIPVPPARADSVLERRKKGMRPEVVAAYDRVKIPTSYPAVREALVGIDGTLWLELRATAPGHHWRALSPKGETLAQVTLPPNVTLYAASRTQLWAGETDDDDVEHVVRYRLVPIGGR